MLESVLEYIFSMQDLHIYDQLKAVVSADIILYVLVFHFIGSGPPQYGFQQPPPPPNQQSAAPGMQGVSMGMVSVFYDILIPSFFALVSLFIS